LLTISTLRRHFSPPGLLKTVLGQPQQVGYLFAEEVKGSQGKRLRVYTTVLPPREGLTF
jgi:hypothetical protein